MKIKVKRRLLRKQLEELLELKRLEDEFWNNTSMEEPSKRWQKQFWQIVTERKKAGYKYANWPDYMGIITPAQRIWITRKGFTVHEFTGDYPGMIDFDIHFGPNIGMLGAIRNYIEA